MIHFLYAEHATHQFDAPHCTLYRTVAYTNGSQIHVPVHGFIYEMHPAFIWSDFGKWGRQIISAIVLYATSFLKSEDEHFLNVQGMFLQFGRADIEVTVQIGDTKHTTHSNWDGYFHDSIIVPQIEATLDGWLSYTVTIEGKRLEGYVQVHPDTEESSKISIISDIDDTIKITNVTSAMAMIRNTFSPFSAVPKMAELYKRWSPKAKFHYVSSSPFQLYSQLEKFIKAEGWLHE